MTLALDDSLHSSIKALCAEGDALAQRKDYQSAIARYREALTLLPAPASNWEAATWIWTAIGDAFFLAGNLDEAYRAFSSATHCPGGIGNPFIHLRLGEIQFDLGNEIIAADELARAYMSGGKRIFNGESPKYFELLKSKMKQPPGGW